MLNKLSVSGFKSLLELQNLELGQVNVLIGANGSGKTNLLEALGVLSAAAAGEVSDKELSARGVRLGIPQLYRTSLKEHSWRNMITFEASSTEAKKTASYKVSLDNPIEAPNPRWIYRTESLWRGQKQIVGRQLPETPKLSPEAGLVHFARRYLDLEKEAENLLDYLESYAIFSLHTPMLQGMVPDSSQRDPLGLFGGRLPEAIEDILDLKEKRLGKLDLDELGELLDWVMQFDITTPSRQLLSPNVPVSQKLLRFEDVWMQEGRNQISGYDASEGVLYVLFVLVLALHPRTPRLFAIDNFDQAMHPRLARAVTRLFCRLMLASDPPRQALLTTHNPLVLDGLDLQDDRIRLFAVERGFETGGTTKIYRVQVSEDILQADQNGLSLSNLWVMGRLGGVPSL
ncbi:MAG: AAA family ATPase [Anaerolineae bacterium]|nr:AAA family ATPase [Anaerolineae bacterium]